MLKTIAASEMNAASFRFTARCRGNKTNEIQYLLVNAALGPGKQTIAHIFVFAFDLNEASQIRRINSLQSLGHNVTTAAFHRSNMDAGAASHTAAIDLGFVENHNFAKRALKIIRGIWRVRKQPQALRDADLIIARNFDLLLIAWASRALLGCKATPLVYECLDIHGLFTRSDFLGRCMRWAERRLLAKIQLLILSSPGFLQHYFKAIQGYLGPATIIENKLWFDGPAPARPKVRRRNRKPDDTALVLGWVGSIRCQNSLQILTAAADSMGAKLQIVINGNIHRHALPNFDAEIAKRPNIRYHGAYSYPDDLQHIYSSCDLVWAQDLWQRGANSDWLLPNRIYEASWFGCPSIAVAGTETGRRVRAAGLGITLETASSAELIKTLKPLSTADIDNMSKAILAMDGGNFQLSGEDIKAALAPVLQPAS